jgi:hypothetical protein
MSLTNNGHYQHRPQQDKDIQSTNLIKNQDQRQDQAISSPISATRTALLIKITDMDPRHYDWRDVRWKTVLSEIQGDSNT